MSIEINMLLIISNVFDVFIIGILSWNKFRVSTSRRSVQHWMKENLVLCHQVDYIRRDVRLADTRVHYSWVCTLIFSAVLSRNDTVQSYAKRVNTVPIRDSKALVVVGTIQIYELRYFFIHLNIFVALATLSSSIYVCMQ